MAFSKQLWLEEAFEIPMEPFERGKVALDFATSQRINNELMNLPENLMSASEYSGRTTHST